ncbi:sulfurtransferase [Sessilibacter corallicola]|uniref:sulfurtransferase n=1 Tax=Sessilibacter corallicola TaxID=2904075 RepID=UPI001E5EA3FA|nr:rhodanese-like domain-containing protein [Sessilibacter corallicola]MCE2027637.1 sulfurtransferase [Sessilibacter corallicola]
MTTTEQLGLIVEPKEFFEWLQDADTSNLLIVDLSTDENYSKAHIEGAIYLPFKYLMAGQPPAPGKLPGKEQLQEVLSQLGLTPDTHVVTYDDEGGGWAGRLIWTLDVIGHTKYSYINGGIHAWLKDGLPVTNEIHKPTPTQYTVGELNLAPLASAEEIMESLGQENFQVWDARTPAEYSGEKVLAKRGGHMPGAINCEWINLMDHQNGLRIRDDADEYLQSLGFSRNQNIVAHCQSHHRSAFSYLVGKKLGYNVRAYDGSWSEWGNLDNTPIEV